MARLANYTEKWFFLFIYFFIYFKVFFLQPNFVLNFGENEDWEKKNGNLSKRKKKQA